MPTLASLTFTPLTDSIVWFADANSFNTWVASITVSIPGSALPVPTTTTAGGIFRETVPNFVPGVVSADTITINADIDGSGNLVAYQTASYAMVLALKTKLDLLAQAYADLLSILNTGQVIQLT